MRLAFEITVLPEKNLVWYVNSRCNLRKSQVEIFRTTAQLTSVRVTEEWTSSPTFCLVTALGRLRFDGLR